MASNTVIRTNVLALNSNRNLGKVGSQSEKASQKLSSGYRINSASDDAAGLAISEKMRAQIRGLDMATKNSQDAISLIQTAEGGMQEIDNMVQRIRELVVYASSDTQTSDDTTGAGATSVNATSDRQKIQDEINTLMMEIDSMAERVEFNKKKVIDGTYANGANQIYFQVGANANQGWTLNIGNLTCSGLGIATGKVDTVVTQSLSMGQSVAGPSTITYTSVTTSGGTTSTLTTTSVAQSGVFYASTATTDVTSLNGGMSAALSAGTNYTDIDGSVWGVTLSGTGSATLDLLSEFTSVTGTSVTGSTLTSTVIPPGTSITGSTSTPGASVWQAGKEINIGATGSTVTSRINVMQSTGAGSLTGLLNTLDDALRAVTTERSKLGAAQNRLEYTINSLEISSENLNSAESRIRNTDMAKEMMNLTQSNVLQQAATSMLAQANQAPQSVLQLLQ